MGGYVQSGTIPGNQFPIHPDRLRFFETHSVSPDFFLAEDFCLFGS
jgi:hypothetical protein